MSLRTRLTIFSALGIALVLALAAVATYIIVREQLRAQLDSTLRDRSEDGIVIAAETPNGSKEDVTWQLPVPPPALPPADSADAPPATGIRISVPLPFGASPVYSQLVDRTGRILARGDARVTLPIPAAVLDVARSRRPKYQFDATVQGTHLRILARRLAPGDALLVALPLTEVDRALDRLLLTLGLIGGVGIAGAALVGGIVARGALQPVRRLTKAAEAVADTHDLGTRIGDDRGDELGRLGAAFDQMLEALEEAVAAQRRLVSDASHELRTPLTSLRTNIEVLREDALTPLDRDKLLDDLAREAEELTTLVTDVVELARGSQREFHLREVGLDELVAAVVGRAQPRYPDLVFAFNGEPTVVVGDADRLDRAVSNLVDNAAKWSPPGGTVNVCVSAGEVVVQDQGPGVAEVDRPFIFERFYRSEAARSRPGSGLGLAIVRQVAEQHGGSIEVEPAEGGGARFRLTLIRSDTNGSKRR